MAKNQHLGKGNQDTQNQNNQMSDDPRDGGRNSFNLKGEGEGPAGAHSDDQAEKLREFGRRGATQN